MVDEFPQFNDVLWVALNLSSRRQNDKAVEQFIEEEESAEITNEVKAAQEGESYAEEKKLNEYNNEQES